MRRAMQRIAERELRGWIAQASASYREAMETEIFFGRMREYLEQLRETCLPEEAEAVETVLEMTVEDMEQKRHDRLHVREELRELYQLWKDGRYGNSRC